MVVFNYQPPSTCFRWSRISFSKKPQLLLFHAAVTPASWTPGSCGRVTRLRFSFGLGEEVALLQRRQKRTYRRNSRKGPRKCKKTMFFQMDGKWWFFKPTIFFHGKDLKKSSNCKLQEALPSGPRWEFYWLDGSCVNLSCEYEICTSEKQQGDPAWRQCLRWSAWRMRKRPWIYMFVKVCASISSWVCKSSVLISWRISWTWATQKPDDFVANMRLGLSKWMIQYL